MQKNIILLFIIISGIYLAGCNKILNVVPLNQITNETVWKDTSLMEAYINNIYPTIGLGEFNSTSGMSDLDDESVWTNGATAVVQSTITSSNLDVLGGSRFNYLVWGTLYSAIRSCNVFLENSATSPYAGTDIVQRLRGEVYFLRGYFYHNLMRTYGAVPLITKVYGLEDSTAVARNTFEETVNFIVADADSAAELLPVSHSGTDIGRATRGAALALKARVLLYAASDLYNEQPKTAAQGYLNTSTADRTARWAAARDAAKAVMDMNMYQLYAANPEPGDSTAANYANLFLTKTGNPEIIFCRYTSIQNGATNVGLWFSPNGYDGYGENSPIQQMVDAYEMKDGTKFDWNNPTEAAHPYENRDPRFYASVFYDGAPWKKRYTDAASYDPVGIVQSFTTLILPNGSTLPGIDTRNGPVENWNGSYSNYYLRKYLDPNNDLLAAAQEIPWIFFRYGEVLLNYAESCIELGQYQEARDALNQIRRRAGMPEFTVGLTGDALKSEYRNERRIEMGFEEQRFFDIRRWKIAPDVMNAQAKGIQITVHGTNRADRSTYHDYEYKQIDIQDRRWNDKMYFIAIPFDEVQKNPLLVQNPSW